MVFQSYEFYSTHHSNLVCQNYISALPKKMHKVIRKLILRNGMILENETYKIAISNAYKIGIGTLTVKCTRFLFAK